MYEVKTSRGGTRCADSLCNPNVSIYPNSASTRHARRLLKESKSCRNISCYWYMEEQNTVKSKLRNMIHLQHLIQNRTMLVKHVAIHTMSLQ